MDDLISRQAAIDVLERKKDKTAKGEIGSFYNTIIQHDIDAIVELPSAQPQRMKGRWYHGDAYPHHLYCSVCYRTALPNDEYVERWNLHMNYCPNCGADMRGEQDGSD